MENGAHSTVGTAFGTFTLVLDDGQVHIQSPEGIASAVAKDLPAAWRYVFAQTERLARR